MSEATPIEQWPHTIEEVLAERCGVFNRITVLRETDSTQDAARRLNARPGDVITTWRQTSGRGRLGRTWTDSLDEGLAVTFVTERRESEFLAVASALGTARAIESVASTTTKIKWPNDILIGDRKIGGILIEQFDRVALIGVGINVHQVRWPANLESRAVSLAQLGVVVDRLDMLAELIKAIDVALQLNSDTLNREFATRDALVGKLSTFRAGVREVTGRVVRVDPMRGIEVELADGRLEHLPAATTTVLQMDATPAGHESAISTRNPVSSHPVHR